LLAVPVFYGAYLAPLQPLVILPLGLLAAWACCALWLLRRRKPGDVPRAVVSLIAGISLLDAMLLAGAGHMLFACLAVVAFGITLALQRWISGT
jgi:4-hydroxybenzoate polyprenyltransferase